MRLLPVLDILNGTAVHAVAGRRSDYRPLQSRLCDTSDPLDVARAFRDRLGLTELYVADLDAILHERPNVELWNELTAEGFTLLLDAGIRDRVSARRVFNCRAHAAILGLETLPGPELLETLIAEAGPQRLLFSLDLKHGAPLGNTASWPSADPLAIAAEAAARGITQLVVLDLAAVGTGTGTPTLELCAGIAEQLKPQRLITGGGIRSADDLLPLAAAGVTDTLVATAFHSGQFENLTTLHSASSTSPQRQQGLFRSSPP